MDSGDFLKLTKATGCVGSGKKLSIDLGFATLIIFYVFSSVKGMILSSVYMVSSLI